MGKKISMKMTPQEVRTALGLAAVYGVRMLGLFMILPVLALYVRDIHGGSATLTGLAIGIYGLTQALLQIPLGMLSDRIGRKKVIIGGLLVFALGSIVAAVSTSIAGLIAGRALQGCGAVAAATLALAADLTAEARRTLVMAIIGMSIGLAFTLSMVIGPVLQQWVGVSGIFWITAVLAMLAISIVKWVVPDPDRPPDRQQRTGVSFFRVLANTDLLRLNVGIFTLHALLAANFVVFPQILVDNLAMPASQHWKLYLAVMLVSIVLMLPFVYLAEKKQKKKIIFVGAVALLLITQVGLYFSVSQVRLMLIAIVLFFVAFNILEATLPSLVSQQASKADRGAAMGVYSTSQFMGIFVGGLAGGFFGEHFQQNTPYLFGASLCIVWLLISMGMRTEVTGNR